jgi:hypothetical protein
MPNVLWIDTNDHTTAILTKDSGETVVLSVGDFVTYEGRPDGVRVEGFTFTNKDNEREGPIGMTYLPWRASEKRWASISWSLMRGNNRHIIAHPCGRSHFGEHIDWNTMVTLNECPSPSPQTSPCVPTLDASEEHL